MDDQNSRIPVFAWITGQDYNIGDSILRRPYVDALARLGDVDLWVRGASDEFLTGLNLDGIRITRSFPRWFGRAIASAIRRPTCVALNAGEIWVSWPRAAMLSMLAILALVARARGGLAVWLGASIRPTDNPVIRAVFRVATMTMTVVWWRESGSNRRALPRSVGPDWAFALGGSTDQWADISRRRRVAFIMRGDRPLPSEAWMSWVERLLARTSLEPVFVVQVRSDDERAAELAARLGGEVFGWSLAASHREQEERVRALYGECALAIGDRLHGLVLAVTEGAVPLGWIDTSGGKIGAHFDAAGFEYVGAFEGPHFADVVEVGSDDVSRWARALPGGLDAARALIDQMCEDLTFAASGRKSSRIR